MHLPSLRLLAKAAAAQGDLPKAIDAFSAYVDLKPEEAAAHHDLANAKLRNGDVESSIFSYRKALEFQPDRHDAKLGLARALVRKKEYHAAEEMLLAFLAAKPAHDAELDLLRLYQAMGKLEAAERLGVTMLARTGSSIAFAVHREIAKILRSQRKWEEAVPHFAAYVAEKPDDASGRHDLGRALFFTAAYEQAETELRVALNKAPSRHGVLIDLGRTLAALDRVEEAEATFRTLIKHTGDVAGYIELARMISRAGAHRKVVKILRDALQANPEDARLYKELALHYRDQGLKRSAQEAFRKALRYANGDKGVSYDYARFQMQIGEYKAALKLLRDISAVEPKRPGLRRVLAKCLSALGEFSEAERLLREKIEDIPENIPARVELGKLLNRQKRYEDAMMAFESVLVIEAENIDAFHGLGVAYRRSGATQRALASFAEAIERDPAHTASYFQLAELAHLAGNLEGVIQYTSGVLAHQPTHTSALMLRAQVAFERGEAQAALVDIEKILEIDSQHAKAELFRDLVRREIADSGGTISLEFCFIDPSQIDPAEFAALAESLGTSVPNLSSDWVQQLLATSADWIVVAPGPAPSREEVSLLKNRIGLTVGAVVASAEAPWESVSIWAREPLLAWLRICEQIPKSWQECVTGLGPRLRLRPLTESTVRPLPVAAGRASAEGMPVAWLVSSSGMNLFGGVERFLRNMVPIYRAMGYEPIIVGLLEKLDGVSREGELDGLKFLNFDRRVDAVREAGLRYRPRIVQCTTGVGYEVAQGLEGQAAHIVYGSHFWRDMFVGTDSFENVDIDGRPRVEFGRLCAAIDQGYANSLYTQEIVRSHFGVIQPIIYSLPFDEPPENVSSEPGRYVLLMNGRPDKGFNLVRQLAKALPNVPFMVVASQVSRERIEEMLRQEGISNVDIVGWVADTASLYRHARAVMVASYAFVETFSRVTIEAHRFGVPVIGSDRGNVPLLLNEAGVSLPEDPVLWASELRRLYEDENYYEERRRLALENSERYKFSDQPSRVSQVVRAAEERIAVAVGSGIGNMIQCAPVIRRISEHFGRPVDVIVKQDFPGCGSLFAGSPYVGQVFENLSLATKVNYRSILVLDAFGDLIPHFNSDSTFVTRRKFPFSMMQDMHESNFNLMCAKEFLGVPYDEVDASKYFLGGMTHDAPKKGRIGLHAGGKAGIWMSKRWPYFEELAQRLVQRGFEVVSFGGKAEYVEGAQDFTGTDLATSLRNINSCEYFIANDSGLMHVADALNIPLTAIFGPTSVVKNGPLSPNSLTIAVEKDCAPCQFDADRFPTCRCIQELSLDDVDTRISNHMKKFSANSES